MTIPTEDFNNYESQGAGWDARQKYTTEIVYRLHLYLDVTKDSLKQKLETLSDLFFTVVGFIDNHKEVRARLEKIEQLLYPPRNTTNNEFVIYKHEARKLLDDVYVDVFLAIKKAGLLVPDKEYTDEVAEFEKLL